MTEAVISGLVRAVLENLSKVVVQEFGIAWGLKKELKKLESTMTTIQSVLQDAEDKQLQSEALRNWLRKLKDTAYDADDIIDEFATKALQQRVDTGSNAVRVVSNFFSLSNPCLFHLKMGHKIKEIGERLDMIAAERSKFHLTEGVKDKLHEIGQRLQTDSLVMESEIYGRVQEKEKIIDLMLIDARDKMDVSVIPIVGMGGLGKTTLAQLAYNDERVVKYFELRMWVYVSEDFDIKRVIKAILESSHGDASALAELDPLQRCLQETLHKKRFLLVLDDVWNEDQDVWDKLRNILRCGGKGSTIIVTTRIEKSAWIMGTLPTQNLSYLSEHDSWSLFKQRAFGIGREENEKLIVIGKEIVKKCRGLPLAAKTLGGLMRFKTNESEWLFVKDSEIWELPQEHNGIIPALRLSYDHLPSHLKQCFTYCCLFPKDSEIEKERVISLWMANGFVPSNERKEPEDIGHEYFDELLWRSFFLDIQRDKYGNIINCKMHDLIHDLALSVAKDEYAIMETYKVENVANRSRHISCNILESVNDLQTLRTVLWNNHQAWDSNILGSLSIFRCLRVLDLSMIFVEELPPSICNLIHLRYLNLSDTEIRTLPESICSLKNLQTLKLRNCEHLCNLPKGLKNMYSLRHLDIHNTGLIEMPKSIGKLINLRTLPLFIVGEESGQHIGELKDFNLRGKLQICNLELVRNKVDAQEANLINKQNLHRLILSWQKCDTGSEISKEEVFEGLQPHPNIKGLGIYRFDGIKLSTWIQDSKFSNLVKIVLNSFRRCEYLPSLGLLPSLENLYIRHMDALKYIGCDFYGKNNNMKGFPSLKKLHFRNMPNLEEWLGVDGRVIFPCLKKLVIKKCPKLRTMPYFPSLKHLELIVCTSVVLMPVANLTSLSFLHLQKINGLMFLPEGMLSHLTLLKSLFIVHCNELRALSEELDNLIALRTLSVMHCNALESLPKGLRSLNSLKKLEITRCNRLISLPEEMTGGVASLHDLPKYLHHVSEVYLGVPNASTMECHFTVSFESADISKPADISTLTGVTINRLQSNNSAEDSANN